MMDWLWESTQRCWDPEASRRPQVSQVLETLHHLSVFILDHVSIGLSGRSAWNRLIARPLTTPERTSLIVAIFTDRDGVGAVSYLCGSDAQSFIEAVDEVFP